MRAAKQSNNAGSCSLSGDSSSHFVRSSPAASGSVTGGVRKLEAQDPAHEVQEKTGRRRARSAPQGGVG